MVSLSETTRQKIQSFTSRRIVSTRRLSGGCIADVFRIGLDDGSCCVAKAGSVGRENIDLTIEAEMLQFLGTESKLPVPDVLLATEGLLLIEYIETDGQIDSSAQTHAAELLADLHNQTAPSFGFSRNTLIGPLQQPNPETESWIEFFRDQRLLHMGRVALDRGRLTDEIYDVLERLCGKLEQLLPAQSKPGLVHGDVWDGNLLVRNGRIAAFIDPATYYGDPEIELAFSTLFGTFDQSFFDRYQELRPLEPGFFECRCDLYKLYPLLVHTALFGGSYAATVAATVNKYA
ncbi:fructosamine kinase family protein [Pelagibius sp. Alg239-R121]|uniref:fructosamine kinase family protein n=1 Tax=Pelagibius sp. Alg239-R121 TaxID=2993448 RepID=UPI0024A73ADA|nr:fructosamine kinase family protein [Pelagibius sp. Alg239-R121]